MNNFQFKYKHKKLVFNHEFYLRKDEEQSKDVEGELEREKSVREESVRLDFMNKFKRCMERSEQPAQKGLDRREDVWGVG
jgi:hypothetical protein